MRFSNQNACKQSFISSLLLNIIHRVLDYRGVEITAEKRLVLCEYLVDNRFCRSIIVGEEGKIVREESCVNKSKNSCCYLCSHQESCKISCTYLVKPKDALSFNENIDQEIEQCKEKIESLSLIFAEGKIREQSYVNSVKTLENRIDKLNKIKEEPLVSPNYFRRSKEVKKTEGTLIEEPTTEGREKPYRKEISEKRPSSASTVMALFLIILVIAVPIIWWWSTIPKAATFTIEIQSTTSWAGSIGADASSSSVEGSGNRSFQVYGTIAVAVIQKQTEYGSLTVRILRDGRVLDSQTTTAAYGVVSVSASG